MQTLSLCAGLLLCHVPGKSLKMHRHLCKAGVCRLAGAAADKFCDRDRDADVGVWWLERSERALSW